MKIFLTADLHSTEHWYQWIVDNQKYYDVVIIAGDMVDMFKNEVENAKITPYLSQIKNLIYCSGNHDFSCDGDMKHYLYKDYMFSTIPFMYEENDRLLHCIKLFLDRGLELKENRKWVLISHEPAFKTDYPGYGEIIRKLVNRYKINWVFSGHIHHFPYTAEAVFKDDEHFNFLPGCNSQATQPNHIVIENNIAQWKYTYKGGLWQVNYNISDFEVNKMK